MTKIDYYLSGEMSVAKGDNDKRTFSGVANSGKPFLHGNQWTVVDFDGIMFEDSVPVLLEHDRARRVGFGKLSVENHQLLVNGNLLSNELSQSLSADADDGFPFQMSAHVKPSVTQVLTGNQTAVVNGQTVSAPITILKKCFIPEVSFTPTGVDNQTSAKFLSDNPNNPQEQDMDLAQALAEIEKLKAEIDKLKAEKDKEIETLTAENEQLKADQSKAEVDAQLSQAGFKKDDKGVWQGISQNMYSVLLSQKADDVKAMINDLKPQKSNAPDYLFSEQFTGGSNEQGSEDDLVAMAKSRNKQ